MKTLYARFASMVGIQLLTTILIMAQNSFSEPWEKGLNERQPHDIVFKAIGMKPGLTIGEIGAGRGRYTVLLARETGRDGKIFANDIDESSLAYIRGRCKRLNLNNVVTIAGEMDNPLFPENSLDMAIMVLVYHMIDNPDNLLRNLKKSLKPGSKLVILDPRDEDIDKEFGIDRSKTDSDIPTIIERIQKSANAAGYELLKVDTILPHDYIFILEPKPSIKKESATEHIQKNLNNGGIESARKAFNQIKSDTAHYRLSEKAFIILGNEYLGAKVYPEALAVLNMGAELYPKSSKIYGTIGEVYLLLDDKENARTYYRLFLENGPDSLNAPSIMKHFDAMYEQMRQQD